MWADSVPRYLLPSSQSTFQQWNSADKPAISAICEIVTESEYWSNLALYLAEESDTESVTQDNISSVKSICEFNAMLGLFFICFAKSNF